MSGRELRLCLVGTGHVGGGFLALLARRQEALAVESGCVLRVVGVADLGGVAWNDDGLDPTTLLDQQRQGVALAAGHGGAPDLTVEDVVLRSRPDVLLVATPVDHERGAPGLDLARLALRHGIDVVLADKGPLSLAFDDLAALSDLGHPGDHRPRLRFSATVAGALPVVNIGARDLAGLHIRRIEGVFNGTSHSILRAMDAGIDFETALADARDRGIVEDDPSLDVDGLDSAFKLLITANTVLGAGARLTDVEVVGIRDVTADDLRDAETAGTRIVPLAVAERQGDRVTLRTAPTALPLDHPLARLHPDEMGVAYYADGVDRIFAASLEPGPEPASAAMLRDVLDIVRDRALGAAPEPGATGARRLRLRRLPGRWVMLQFAADAEVPAWATAPSTFSSVTRTATELSLIVPETSVPAEHTAAILAGTWGCLGIDAQFTLDEPGIAAAVARPLAAAGHSVFVVATVDTDHFLVRDVDAAAAALRAAGHEVDA